MNTETAWLCIKHLEEARRDGHLINEDTTLRDMQTILCDVSGCSGHGNFVLVSTDFFLTEA